VAKDIIAQRVAGYLRSASWIREMFETGLRMKAEFGEQNVHDFSLGNPNATPPEEFFAALRTVAAQREPSRHRYMPNPGFREARETVARLVREEYGLDVDADAVILTTGAAGGLNVALRAICDPGDEVIVLAPYFPEYRFYVEQAGGRMVLVQTDAEFQPDLEAIEAAITERTRAVLVNSPNNPTGVIYDERRCRAMGELLSRHDSDERPIYLITDDPYRRIVFDVERPPTPLSFYHRVVLVSSYSKDLSIPGERAGYIAVPACTPGRQQLLAAMIMLNRTLGMINLPAFMQRVITLCGQACCDVGFYRRNRDRLCEALRGFGYQFVWPQGALYVFPRTPIDDDVAFTRRLMEHRILVVPGRGFGRPGHVRISFAVEPETIERALPGFEVAIRSYGR